jgi:hypothetical protein
MQAPKVKAPGVGTHKAELPYYEEMRDYYESKELAPVIEGDLEFTKVETPLSRPTASSPMAREIQTYDDDEMYEIESLEGLIQELDKEGPDAEFIDSLRQTLEGKKKAIRETRLGKDVSRPKPFKVRTDEVAGVTRPIAIPKTNRYTRGGGSSGTTGLKAKKRTKRKKTRKSKKTRKPKKTRKSKKTRK